MAWVEVGAYSTHNTILTLKTNTTSCVALETGFNQSCFFFLFPQLTMTGNLWDNYVKDSSDSDDPKAICKECGRVYNLKIAPSFVLHRHLRKEHSIICAQLPQNEKKRKVETTETQKLGLLAPFSYLEGITITPSKKPKVENAPKIERSPKIEIVPKLVKKTASQQTTTTHSVSNTVKITDSKKISTLDSGFIKTTEFYSPNDAKQLRTDLEVVAMLAQCNLPFSHIESQGFKRFISHLDPKVTVKSADTYSKTKLPLLYKNVQREVHRVLEKDLPQCDGVAFTVSENSIHDSARIFEVHYIDKDWALKSYVVDCKSEESSLEDVIKNITALQGCAHTTAVFQNDTANCDVIKDKMICCKTILSRAVQHALDSTPDLQV